MVSNTPATNDRHETAFCSQRWTLWWTFVAEFGKRHRKEKNDADNAKGAMMQHQVVCPVCKKHLEFMRKM